MGHSESNYNRVLTSIWVLFILFSAFGFFDCKKNFCFCNIESSRKFFLVYKRVRLFLYKFFFAKWCKYPQTFFVAKVYFKFFYLNIKIENKSAKGKSHKNRFWGLISRKSGIYSVVTVFLCENCQRIIQSSFFLHFQFLRNLKPLTFRDFKNL